MDEDAEIIVDGEALALCRLCIKNRGRFQIGKGMHQQMKECFDITIDSFDGMSQIICEICKKLVTEIILVRKRFKNNQIILLERRKQLCNKDEDRRSPSPICIESDGENKKDEVDVKEKTSSPKSDTINKNTSPKDEKPVSPKPDPIPIPKVVIKSPKNNFKPSSNTKPKEEINLNKNKSLTDILNNTLLKNKSSISNTTILIDSESGSSCSNSQENKTKTNSSNTQVYLDDSDDDDDITVPRKKYVINYNCRVCCKVYNKKNKMKEHIVTSHNYLYNKVQELCKPSSVKLLHISMSSASPEETNHDWVRLNQDKILKFTPQHQLFYTSRSQRKENNIILSSSDDEEDNTKLQTYKRILSNPRNKIIRKGSTEKYNRLFGNDSDSSSVEDDNDKSKSYFKNLPAKRDSGKGLKVTLKKVIPVESASDSRESSRRPSEDELASDVESYSSSNTFDKEVSSSKDHPVETKMAITEDEISKIIENCYKTAKIKQSLTAPINKDWLIKDITNKSSLNVVWVNCDLVKVSRISSNLKQGTQDIVSQLPAYASDKNTSALGHLKLLRPVPRPNNIGTQQTVKGGTIKRLGKNQVLVRKDKNINITINCDPDVQPIVRDMPQLQLLESPTAPKITTNTTTKRPLDVVQDTLPKRPCINEPQFMNMNPIIVSTMSLAKNATSSDVPVVTVSEDVSPPVPTGGRPVIKCKPTSLLMPSPMKVTTNNDVLNKPVEPSIPPPQIVGNENQNNTIMFTGYNIQINNTTNNIVQEQQNYTQMNTNTSNTLVNNNLINRAPPLLNSIIASSETPALLSSDTINIESVQNGPMYPNQQFYQPNLQSTFMNNNAAPVTPSSLYPNMMQSSFPDMTNNYLSIPQDNGGVLNNSSVGQNSEFIDINSQYCFRNGIASQPVVSAPSILSKLQDLLKNRNVILNTCLSVPTKYSKLLRFVLTIKEKNYETPMIISREFIVEVCMQTDGVLVLNISDNYSTIDVSNWTNEFQVELVNALKKRDFLMTMKKVSCNMDFSQTVCVFAEILEKFVPNMS